VREAIDRFTREHMPTLKPGAIRRYYTSSEWVLKHFGDLRLRDVRSKALYEFEQWRKKMRHRGKRISIVTIKRDLAFLSSVMSEAEVWEWHNHNPVKAYIRGRRSKGIMVEAEGRERYLSHEEEARLLAAQPEDVSSEDLAMIIDAIKFAVDTGLRAEEQWTRQREHFNFARLRVYVSAEDAKSSRSRWTPILPRSAEIINRLRVSNRSAYLFWRYDGEKIEHTWAYRILQKMAKAAGIADLEWHDLRRTCGCRLLQDYKLPMDRVSRWLGHSSVKVTEKHYAFLRVEDLENAIEDSQYTAPVPGDDGHSRSGPNGHNPATSPAVPRKSKGAI
jgi:integrase